MNRMSTFEFDIQQIQEICLVKLSWGYGQKLSVELPYPASLERLYQSWQRAYLSFYRQSLRGKKQLGETLAITEVDWRIKLVQAEAALLAEFHQWLRCEALYDIRSIIVQATKVVKTENIASSSEITIFLTCHSQMLEALPWETWEIAAESGTRNTIRIIRSPAAIRYEPTPPRSGRTRILVIAGDDTGLELMTDWNECCKSLKGLASLEILGWGISSQDVTALKRQLLTALVDEQGWDAILFFGHSDAGSMTGGELAIAPQTWIGIDEIQPQLLQAKQRGLQFALFNSCNGLNIAEALINLGLSQVIVMREPIHNQVAQQFLVDFLQSLAQHQDVYQATVSAIRSLKLNHALTYPSAYLLPSLFCHHQADLFRIPARDIKAILKKLLPTPKEAITLGVLFFLSLGVPVQEHLLDARLGVQAVYRLLTQQLPEETQPPVNLVMIDQESLTKARVPGSKYVPLDRRYLARLLQKSSSTPGAIIGIDYLFDRPTPEDPVFLQAIHQAVKRGSWLVFATSQEENSSRELTVAVEGISNYWSLSANIDIPFGYLELPSSSPKCPNQCPFSYLLGLVHALQGSDRGPKVVPQLRSQSDLSDLLFSKVQEHPHAATLEFFSHPQPPLNLEPIVDFSIPPKQVYKVIPAWKTLKTSTPFPFSSSSASHQPIIIIAAGGYDDTEDVWPLPLATQFWLQLQKDQRQTIERLTGGEVHAYMVHHWVSRHRVLALPDMWLLVLAILLGKSVRLMGVKRPRLKPRITYGLMGGVIFYGFSSLQVFISYGVLLPWLFPTITVLGYGWFTVRGNVPNTTVL